MNTTHLTRSRADILAALRSLGGTATSRAIATANGSALPPTVAALESLERQGYVRIRLSADGLEREWSAIRSAQ